MKAKVKKQIDEYFVIFEAKNDEFGWFELGNYVELEEDDAIIGNFEKYDITEITLEKTGKAIEIICVEDFGEDYEYCLKQIKKENKDWN